MACCYLQTTAYSAGHSAPWSSSPASVYVSIQRSYIKLSYFLFSILYVYLPFSTSFSVSSSLSPMCEVLVDSSVKTFSKIAFDFSLDFVLFPYIYLAF
jgi:hypothetical protein